MLKRFTLAEVVIDRYEDVNEEYEYTVSIGDVSGARRASIGKAFESALICYTFDAVSFTEDA